MNIIKLGVLVCSSLPLYLSCFVESIAQHFDTSQSHFTSTSKVNMMNKEKEDASTIANVAAQNHFRQIQHFC
ncbi:hypothetical protein MtrunA17_Chr5g0434351 [Medicago truncatula]|uniref:Transmembrane protein n=1 Tax=Medicago truncatula TaxID=3880 RepID=G7KG17_MEDTR|nr:hypothetical protein MTR_5g077760 [Medicago truncatula]RHN56889.1 hypothetical protein MtrunA17_Chr5g0434351 [Medicago truncatula]